MSDTKEILSKHKTIAMIGVSKDLTKSSTVVMKYMQKYGYKVIPVNPRIKGEKILGEEVFGKLDEVKIPVDIVDIFRPSEEALGIAEDAIKIKAKVFWLQLGISNDEAKTLVVKNNIDYIENRCTKIEYQKFFLKKLKHFQF
jgi:predicted CoA-binding protein